MAVTVPDRDITAQQDRLAFDIWPENRIATDLPSRRRSGSERAARCKVFGQRVNAYCLVCSYNGRWFRAGAERPAGWLELRRPSLV